jgi:hypothetical protein
VFDLDFTQPETVCEQLARDAQALPRYEPHAIELADFAAPSAAEDDAALADQMTV